MTRASHLALRNGKADYLPEGRNDPNADGVRLMIRVAFGRHGALGPGKMRLLELIDQHGSITAACKEMGMSYRRAWLLVEGLKQAFREPVLTTQQGGVSGGGCSLTPYGRTILQRYRMLERKARDAVRKELHSLEAELLPRTAIPVNIADKARKAMAG
jgi:molybdate transport system regulatory protein